MAQSLTIGHGVTDGRRTRCPLESTLCAARHAVPVVCGRTIRLMGA